MMIKWLCVGFVFGFTTTANANVVWPALYAESAVTSWPIIVLSLILEFFVIRWLFKRNAKISAFYTLAANLASSLIGYILRPLSGLAWEFALGWAINSALGWGTFNPIAWILVPILGGAINAVIELGVIRWIWKEKLTRRVWIIFWAINALTVGIATAVLLAMRPGILTGF